LRPRDLASRIFHTRVKPRDHIHPSWARSTTIKTQQRRGGNIFEAKSGEGLVKCRKQNGKGDTTRYMEIMLNTIKSTVINYNSLNLVSTYFPDSNKVIGEFQEFLDTFSDQIRSIDRNSFIIIEADTNASLPEVDSK
jgi:hypothetical protein